jgi:hypothetical protein
MATFWDNHHFTKLLPVTAIGFTFPVLSYLAAHLLRYLSEFNVLLTCNDEERLLQVFQVFPQGPVH